jgi:hypothetical protein
MFGKKYYNILRNQQQQKMQTSPYSHLYEAVTSSFPFIENFI